jgi:hypothetical protein
MIPTKATSAANDNEMLTTNELAAGAKGRRGPCVRLTKYADYRSERGSQRPSAASERGLFGVRAGLVGSREGLVAQAAKQEGWFITLGWIGWLGFASGSLCFFRPSVLTSPAHAPCSSLVSSLNDNCRGF